jgi:hypothetical protein
VLYRQESGPERLQVWRKALLLEQVPKKKIFLLEQVQKKCARSLAHLLL